MIGETTIDGISQYELKINLKNGETESWYLDAETFLPTIKSYKMDFGERHGDLAVQTVKIYFSDYKPVEGILFPHYSERVARIFHFAIETDSIMINIPIDEKLFEVNIESTEQ